MAAALGAMLLLAAGPLAGQSASSKKPARHKATQSASAAKAKHPGTGKRKAAGIKGERTSGSSRTGAHGSRGKGKRGRYNSPATPESRRLSTAFVASAQLRPMAQQLAATRSAAAYAAVENYAASHPGDAAATAQLALGHAFMLDHRASDAEAAFKQAGSHSDALGDYADYLQAQAAVQAGRPQDTIALLAPFAEHHPGSLFVPAAPVLLANAYLAGGDPAGALRTLQAHGADPSASHVDFRLTLAKASQAAGNTAQASTLYRAIYLGDPLSPEAGVAKTQLAAMNVPLTAGERKQHADAMFNAKQYAEAESEYRSIEKSGDGLSQADRDALEIYSAVCNLRLKKLSRGDVEHLPVTNDDSAALKMYLQSELARNENKFSEHDALVQELMAKYGQSRWLEEALVSGGNMYLIRHDSEKAIADYTILVERFPHSTYAPVAHWHAAWLNYRLRRYPEAARLMEEQVTRYPEGSDIPGALYWRGRLYEDIEHDFGQAINFYKAVDAAYVNSYYAILARQRLTVLGNRDTPAPAPALASVRQIDDPGLTDELPENDPHLIKARLLANAALNEYIRPEIQLSDTSSQWGAFAEAQIYQGFGENTRAIQSMKRSKLPFFSLAVDDVPTAYWELIFPRPYWQQLAADAQANNLDPYLVASLIRQESEFNPGAVSRANAYGLMQLLPSVGKSLAKSTGDKHLTTTELLDPTINLRLGTLDLRKTIDRYNGQVEYALAAYNAGDTPVRLWISSNDYKDIPEWVESIPYTETREYVQAILRNREIYRAVYAGR